MLAKVSEGDLSHVADGMTARVTPVGSQQSFMGRVWQVSPVVDPESRLGMARIALGYQKAIRPGGFASVRIVSGTTQAPLLPESARSEERRVGKGGVSTCRSRWSAYH